MAAGGLQHNKVTHRIRLEPFTLPESRDYLASRNVSLSDLQIAELYMAIDRADGCINLCEMKFGEAPFVIDKRYAAVLRRETGTRKSLFPHLRDDGGRATQRIRTRIRRFVDSSIRRFVGDLG